MTTSTIRIKVTDGNETSIYRTSASTVGELFEQDEFREDFNISTRAVPTINGVIVDGDTELTQDVLVGSQLTASSKS